ncbi:hypothetical protein T439DRAFT_321247 [Meredithblackwellia eburnea MCA 4105]
MAPALVENDSVSAEMWPHWGRPDDHINITVNTDGPLVECADVRLDWASPLIPKDRSRTYMIDAMAYWPDDKGRHSTVQSQQFVTPATSHVWNVDYPAGTIIQFMLSPWWGGRPGTQDVFGQSINYTVVKGATDDCIPRDHFPILTTPPTKLIECEPAVFTYEGGEGPFDAFVWGTLADGNFAGGEMVRNVGNNSFAWVVDYPKGSKVSINIYQQLGWTQTQIEMTVTEEGTSKSCIPTSHLPRKKRWYRRPLFIVLLVFGSLWAGALVGFLAYKGFLYYQAHRPGGIQLDA